MSQLIATQGPDNLPTLNGTTDNPDAIGVLGQNQKGGVAIFGSSIGVGSGFLGGKDPQFHQHAGAYGESDQQGVIGIGTTSTATGVFGGSRDDNGFGVRGESREGVAIQGRSFSGNQGLAGRFIGNVHVQGNPGTSSGDLRVEGTTSFGGLTTLDGGARVNGDVEITGNLNMSSPTSDIVLGDVAEGFSPQDDEI